MCIRDSYITMPEIMEELEKYEVTADRKTIYADLRDLSVLCLLYTSRCV